MQLRFIERGTPLSISEGSKGQTADETNNAIFYDLQNDTSFIAQCEELYNSFSSLDRDSRLNISFSRGPNFYTFTGKAEDLVFGGSYLVLVKQLSGIETVNRREHPRDEIRVAVQLSGLPKADLENNSFAKPAGAAEYSDETFDISAGGLCIITNEQFSSEHAPYYLVSFTLGGRDEFLLPAELVRKGNCPKTWLGRYEYGFKFIFDNIPDEKSRLITSIFNTKLSAFNR